jgi:hypothetical protein
MELVATLGLIVIFFNEWITSYERQQKYYNSILSLIAIVITTIYILVFWDEILLNLLMRSGWNFWLMIPVPLFLSLQYIEKIRVYLRSKREERVFINTVNHIINSQYKDVFTIYELKDATGIPYDDTIKAFFSISKRNGDIPHTAILTE